MEYTGLVIKYPIHRELTNGERENQLRQNVRLDVEPIHQLSVISLNSTYMELVDKFYAWKGVLTTFSLASISLFAFGLVSVMFDELHSSDSASGQPMWFLLFVLALFGGAVAGMIWLLRKEAFALTHYPIRFNRKTRQVHVFRLDGSVFTVPWDDVFFCLASLPQGASEIQGHVLDKDRSTVLETFALSVWGAGRSDGKQLKRFWEFVRRYMESGPQDAYARVQICLPISQQRESLRFAFHRMQAEAGSNAIFALILGCLALVLLPGRWLAMRTSKIPVWPTYIDAEHAVTPGDPYAVVGDARGEKVGSPKTSNTDAGSQKQIQQQEATIKRQANQRKTR